MDRKVIVLSPEEWDSKIELGQSLQMAYDHSHYAVTRVGSVKAALYNLIYGVTRGNSGDEIVKEVMESIELLSGVTSEIRSSQSIVSGISTVIKYKLKEESA